jgi:DNA-directed RNA polymerase subunit M/transcription elongation factor TFIIS
MSSNLATHDGIARKEITLGDEVKVQRRANFRHQADPMNDAPYVPDEQEVEWTDLSFLFDDDGSLRDADAIGESEFDPVAYFNELSTDDLSWGLFDYDKEAYNRWTVAVEQDMFPDATPKQLALKAWKIALEENDETLGDVAGEYLPTTDNVFRVTLKQQETSPDGQLADDPAEIKAEIMPDGVDVEMLSCPECETGSLSKQGLQTGAADEGQTVFLKCGSCDYTSKGGYGG